MKKELMKRVAAAGLAVSMVAGLTACGPTGKPEETKKECSMPVLRMLNLLLDKWRLTHI